jgi:hypothetical protein
MFPAILAGAATSAQVVTSDPFLGVKLYSITQTSPRPLNIRLLEIDLTDPSIRFRNSPRDPGLANGDETITQMTRDYANEQSAQVAINTSFYRLENSGEARATNNLGLLVSDGDKISPWDSTGEVGINLAQNNVASFVSAPSSRPTGFETSPSGVALFNAVRGSNRLLNAGTNVAPADSTVAGAFLNLNPRTAMGFTATNKLLLATIDGRQSGFSEGMYLREVADLLKSYGATEAVNLDGGGSTTMAVDYYGDGGTRSQLVNRPVGRGTIGSERYNGASLGVFAARNPAYVPPTGVVTLPPPPAGFKVLEDFEDSNGKFNTDPDFSGSNRGIFETVDGTGPSSAERDANQSARGFAGQQIKVVSQDDATWTGWRLRHVSGGGSPGNNQQMGTSGYVGLWIKTTTAGLQAAIGIDENLTTTVEMATPFDLIADGQWRLYEWSLSDPTMWESFSNGNGQIDGPVTTVDSLILSSLTDQNATVWFDTMAYNPNGSIATLVPEPSGLALAAIAGCLTFTRHRQRPGA